MYDKQLRDGVWERTDIDGEMSRGRRPGNAGRRRDALLLDGQAARLALRRWWHRAIVSGAAR